MEPRRGAIALCSLRRLGLITSDAPREITYPDGNKGVAWTGIQLVEEDVDGTLGGREKGVYHQKVGDPWSSRTPIVVGYIEDMLSEFLSVE